MLLKLSTLVFLTISSVNIVNSYNRADIYRFSNMIQYYRGQAFKFFELFTTNTLYREVDGDDLAKAYPNWKIEIGMKNSQLNYWYSPECDLYLMYIYILDPRVLLTKNRYLYYTYGIMKNNLTYIATSDIILQELQSIGCVYDERDKTDKTPSRNNPSIDFPGFVWHTSANEMLAGDFNPFNHPTGSYLDVPHSKLYKITDGEWMYLNGMIHNVKDYRLQDGKVYRRSDGKFLCPVEDRRHRPLFFNPPATTTRATRATAKPIKRFPPGYTPTLQEIKEKFIAEFKEGSYADHAESVLREHFGVSDMRELDTTTPVTTTPTIETTSLHPIYGVYIAPVWDSIHELKGKTETYVTENKEKSLWFVLIGIAVIYLIFAFVCQALKCCVNTRKENKDRKRKAAVYSYKNKGALVSVPIDEQQSHFNALMNKIPGRNYFAKSSETGKQLVTVPLNQVTPSACRNEQPGIYEVPYNPRYIADRRGHNDINGMNRLDSIDVTDPNMMNRLSNTLTNILEGESNATKKYNVARNSDIIKTQSIYKRMTSYDSSIHDLQQVSINMEGLSGTESSSSNTTPMTQDMISDSELKDHPILDGISVMSEQTIKQPSEYISMNHDVPYTPVNYHQTREFVTSTVDFVDPDEAD